MTDYISFENLLEGINREAELRESIKTRTVKVRWNEELRSITYKILSPNHSELCIITQENILVTQPSISATWDKVRERISVLSATGAGENRETWQNIWDSIQSISDRFAQIIPDSIKRFVNTWKSSFTVNIDTNETWIPWELMYDTDSNCFWGNKFTLARIPFLQEKDTDSYSSTVETAEEDIETLGGADFKYDFYILAIAKSVSNQFNRLLGFYFHSLIQQRLTLNIHNVVGSELSASTTRNASQLFDFLPDRSGFTIKTLSSITHSSLAEKLKWQLVDILNITCHGRCNPHYLLQISEDSDYTQNLTPERVRELEIEKCKLVFLNACNSTTPYLDLFGFNSFGWEFYRQGVGVTIGTLGEIPQLYMCQFSFIFYKALFGGRTISQSFAIAKRVLRNKHPFALLYSIYGKPNLRII